MKYLTPFPTDCHYCFITARFTRSLEVNYNMESEIQGVHTLQHYIAIHWSKKIKNDSLNKQQHKDMFNFNNIENEEAFVKEDGR